MKSGIQAITLANRVKRTWVSTLSERSDVDEGNAYSNKVNVPLHPSGPLLQASYPSLEIFACCISSIDVQRL